MTPLPPAPNVIKVAHKFDLGEAADCRAHLFVKYSGGPPSAADLTTMATTAAVAWTTDLLGFLSTSYKFNGIEMTDLGSVSGAYGEHLVIATGTEAGSEIGGQASAVLNLVIARRYRGGKPKSFWPLFTASDVNDASSWKAASVSALATAFSSYTTALLGASAGTTTLVELVNVSYYTAPNVVTVSPTTGRATNRSTRRTSPLIDSVTSSAFSSKIGSQRRRRNLAG